MYVKELDIFLTMKVLENTPAVLSPGKLCDEHGYSYEWINGQKTRIIKKRFSDYSATRRTSYRSWFQACQRARPPFLISQLQGHLQDRRVIVPNLLQARLRHRQQHQVIMRLETERIELKVIPLQCLCQLMLMIERGNPLCSDIPEWLQEFMEKFGG